MKNPCALLEATLTPSGGMLLSNLHFQILYIGNERDIWDKFYQYAYELHNADIMANPGAPTARGIDPEYGFEKVYRIQYLSTVR